MAPPRQHPGPSRLTRPAGLAALARRTALASLATGLLLSSTVTGTATPPAPPSPALTSPTPTSAGTPAAVSPAPTGPSAAASSPAPTTAGSPTLTPTPSGATPTPSLPSTGLPTPSLPSTGLPTPSSTRAARAQAGAQAPTLTLAVRPVGGPVAAFYQDLGAYGIGGTTTGVPDGTPVEVYRRAGPGAWSKVAETRVTTAAYAVRLPVQALGSFTFQTTPGGAPGGGDAVQSKPVTVVVADSKVVLDRPVSTVDSLKAPTVKGSVAPARAGVEVHVDVRTGSSFRLSKTAVTDAKGRWATNLSHGRGHLATYSLRATFHATNRDRWEYSGTRTVQRVAVLNAVLTRTTAAEVAKTYRAGCPVGRSKLSTITMNYYGRDKLMHRGVLIIRSDRTGTLTRSFGKALAKRYPIDKLNNPNVYGGNDPRQMAANNTSGFNCRKVVGNPYAQSPHSYGIAIDVNTVQNPYRDARGTWWPSNGRAYIDRSPLRWGMLAKTSTLTAALRGERYFWGGLWSPGRDYQHFERR